MKISFEKISYIFGHNLANLGSFYDRLLFLGPLPGTLLFWPRARASPSLDPSKKSQARTAQKKSSTGRARAEPQARPITTREYNEIMLDGDMDGETSK